MIGYQPDLCDNDRIGSDSRADIPTLSHNSHCAQEKQGGQAGILDLTGSTVGLSIHPL